MVTALIVVLVLLSAGCATGAPPQPEVAATEPATPPPVAVRPATPPVASKPVVAKPAAPRPQPARAAAAPPSVKATPAKSAAMTLDVDALKARLRATKAIGVFTKLSLKNKVDDLMQQFTEHYQGKKPPIAELRQSYDLLMMKVLTLLQDGDAPLAMAVVSSREAIWALLANEKTFAALNS